jgi:hypothetical protein
LFFGCTLKHLVVFNKRKHLHFPRAASTKTLILLGVCLKQPLTEQAIKTFTEHCACLTNSFAEKLQKLRKAKTQKSTDFSCFIYIN